MGYEEGALNNFKKHISADSENLEEPNTIIPIGTDGMTYKYELGSSTLPDGLEEDIKKETSLLRDKDLNHTTNGKEAYINKCKEILSIINSIVSKEVRMLVSSFFFSSMGMCRRHSLEPCYPHMKYVT